MLRTLITLLLLTPTVTFAAGSSDSKPPKPTPTSETCEKGQVWDEHTSECVDVESHLLDDDELYGAVREFAYAGRYDDALGALAAMSNPQDDRVLTYRGFIARKEGDFERAMGYYQAALTQNPDNILARSYMGQGLAAIGDLVAAKAQLTEIRLRGGRQTWAEYALAQAIETGVTHSY